MRKHDLSAITCLLCLACPCYSIWPIPQKITNGYQALLLSPQISVVLDLENTPDDLLQAIARTRSRLFTDSLARLVVGRGSSDISSLTSAHTLTTLRLTLVSGATVRSISEESVMSLEERSEGYSLTVPGDGTEAVITANSTLGIFRGLSTFEQLWYNVDGRVYAIGIPLNVADEPAYSYRGFGLDTSRNFFTVSDILRTLDTMSWVKLNTLYWHIVDAQSFPLEVEAFPELARAGAYSELGVYTQSDVEEIISYAAARGIDVVLELDTPGHETAIGLSHPEHVACYLASPWTEFSSEPPAGQLRLATPSTVNFTKNLISSVAKSVRSSLFSTGGDEVNTNCYAQDTQTQKDLADSGLSLDEALDSFLHETHAVLTDMGKGPIVKEDMILKHNTTLPTSTVVVVWISSQDAKNITSKGYRIIHQPSDYFYLDCGGGEWLGNDIPGNSWCDPFKSWQRIYSFEPLANLTAEEARLVIGGQIPLWSEQTSPANLDSIVWPRAASAAEVFWSGGTSNDMQLNVSSALPRLHDIRYRMVQRGVKAIPLQPEWCALRPGACDADA